MREGIVRAHFSERHGGRSLHVSEGIGHFLEFEDVLADGSDDAAGERQVAELRREFRLEEADLLAGSSSDMLVPLEQ